ncbi:MAG: DnaJ domain-containing protein [bacterium]|nr:DnaJ domain-containing protein [bacterium]
MGKNGRRAGADRTEDFDYYELFELGPNARIDTIHGVYRLLARRYHPDNPDTGDECTFRHLVEAYKVLSDPESRAAYDVQWHAKQKLQWKIFDRSDAATKMAGEKRKRKGILSLLYTKRVNVPDQPTLTMAEMVDLLGCAREHLGVSLWYLSKRGWVERSDNGRYSITVDGFDEAEAHGTWQAPKDRLLTDGKGDGPQPSPRQQAPVPEPDRELRNIVAQYRL